MVDRDNVRGGLVRVKLIHQCGAAAQHGALVDRALVGGFAGIERRRLAGPVLAPAESVVGVDYERRAVFFGAAQAFRDTLGRVAGRPKVLIIRMRHVPAIDSTGMRSLRDVVHRSRQDGTIVLVTELNSQPLEALRGTPTFAEIGMDNFCPSLDFALARAQEFL